MIGYDIADLGIISKFSSPFSVSVNHGLWGYSKAQNHGLTALPDHKTPQQQNKICMYRGKNPQD